MSTTQSSIQPQTEHHRDLLHPEQHADRFATQMIQARSRQPVWQIVQRHTQDCATGTKRTGPLRGSVRLVSDRGRASCLLLLVEVGQQAERALEHLRRDQAGGQVLLDLQADQHRLADGPDLDGRDPCGELDALVPIGVG